MRLFKKYCYTMLILFMCSSFALADSLVEPASSSKLNYPTYMINDNQSKALTAHGVLSVGFYSDVRPFHYNSQSGSPSGITVDVIKSLAEKHNLPISIKKYEKCESDEDCARPDIILTLIGANAEISNFYTASPSYYTAPLLQLRNNTTPHAIDMIAYNDRLGRLYSDPFNLSDNNIEKAFPDTTIINFDTMDEMMKSFNKEKLESVLFMDIAKDFVYSYVDDYEDINVHDANISMPLVFYVSKTLSGDVISALDEIVSHVDNSAVNEIVVSQSSDVEHSFKFIVAAKNNKIFILLVMILLTLVIVNIWIFSKRRYSVMLYRMLNYDILTGALTIRRFKVIAQRLLADADAREYKLISLDIDMFKTINDFYGFDKGTLVVKTMVKAFRAYYGSNALIAHDVADHIYIFTKDQANVKHIFKRVVMPQLQEIIGRNYSITLSIGVYVIENTFESLNVMIDRVNTARLSGKGEHKTSCKLYTSEMHRQYEMKKLVIYRMERALKNNEFRVIYQPKIDLNTYKISGAEALIRWMPEGEDTIYPNDFIPIFESNRFIIDIDLYVFKKVCKFIKQNEGEVELPRISVNISGATIMKSDIVERLIAITNNNKILPAKIELEITESVLMNNSDEFVRKVQALKKYGFAVSMDDFGAGASSFTRISSIDVDVIKLDKSFIDHNSLDNNGSVVVAGIIEMSHKLNMKVVAEGIETLEQAKWLQGIGCNYAQGYYFERPMFKEAFIELLRKNKLYKVSERAS